MTTNKAIPVNWHDEFLRVEAALSEAQQRIECQRSNIQQLLAPVPGEYWHDPHCNANRHMPQGCGMCSCWEYRAVKAEQQVTQQEAALAEATRKLEMLPADWQIDSSLETWFPFTAEIVKRQQAAIGAYEQQVTQQVAAIGQLREVLKKVEWIEIDGERACLFCFSFESFGLHQLACEWRIAMETK